MDSHLPTSEDLQDLSMRGKRSAPADDEGDLELVEIASKKTKEEEQLGS